MKSTALGGLGIFTLIAIAVTAACSSDDSGGGGSNVDGADAATACPANAKECVNDHLARVCPADGSGWLSQPCNTGEKCVDGACALDVNAQCSPALDTCSGDSALKCKPDGKGYDVIKCPPGTKCIGAGKCMGACEVGTSSCGGTSVVQQCVDGLQLKQVSCPAGQYCVTTGTNKADCVAGDCTPSSCDVCGNKVDPSADQTKFVSRCVATPTGYKWEAIGCAAGASCNPTGGGTCNGPLKDAACSGGCTPGATRCSSTGNGIQTCDANGQWGTTIAPCNPDPTNGGLVCMTDLTKPNAVLCGDPLCQSYQGQCDETGKIRLCGDDRKVAANATACTSGACQEYTTYQGRAAGNCVAQCQAGDERCTTTGGNTYQGCENGVWGAVQTCATGQCTSYTNTAGRPAKLCDAVCVPGTHRCTSSTTVQTCSNTGQWGADATCAIGTCKSSGGDYACVADCIPNALMCTGLSKAGVGQYPGTESYGNCTADGKYPTTTTPCDGAKTCRTNKNGIPIGCLECMGPNHGGNTLGVADSRCTDNTGATGYNTSTEFCQANDTWPAAPVDCPQGTSCQTTAYSCSSCYIGGYYQTCTESAIKAYYGSTYTCLNWTGYAAGQCGATTDCCGAAGSGYCYSYGTGPATCK